MPFGNSLGWYAFLALVPLILLYFVRPRPKKTTVSSLMFFTFEKGFLRRAIFLRRLLRNLLFLIHLLLIGLLALALTAPYLERPVNAAAENTVVVIDVSASMQAMDGSQSRFAKAVEAAKGVLDGRVSVVLATNVPLVLLEKGSVAEAERILESVQARDTTTNIGDAMLTAADLVVGERGRVYVFSDFRNNEGPDPVSAKRVLLSQKLEVEMVNLISRVDNAGMIGLDVGRLESSVVVKNYRDKPVSVSLNVGAGKIVVGRTVLPGGVETLAFETPQGVTKLELLPADNFMTDNVAYISAPDTSKTRVLFITNRRGTNLQTALEAAKDIELTIAEPPVVPDFNYEVIVMHAVQRDFMLPGFFDEMERRLQQGASVIVTAQEDLPQMDFGFLPLTFRNLSTETSDAIFSPSAFTRHIVGKHVAEKYFHVVPRENVAVLAAAERGGVPLLTLNSFGKGSVVYYGFFDGFSSFKSSTDYPIFWNLLVNHLVQREDLGDFNLLTGKVLAVQEQDVLTPAGKLRASRVLFDRVGEYRFDGRSVAVNLANAQESDVSGERTELLEEEAELVMEQRDETERNELSTLLAGIALLLVLGELVYLKYRGDL